MVGKVFLNPHHLTNISPELYETGTGSRANQDDSEL